MKVAEWLTAIFKKKKVKKKVKNAPLFQTYQIVPAFEPTAATQQNEVLNSFFFSIFEAGSADWIKAPIHTMNAYPYFNALNCGCESEKLLRSIKGALILQTLTGSRDRHKGNLQMRNCKLINMDYGHSLGHRAIMDREGGLGPKYLTAYSSYLKTFLY